MKHILVLGAGLVARPLVRYLLDVPEFNVKVASRTVSKAQKLINNHPRGIAQELLVQNQSDLEKAVREADLVISLLPWVHHMKVANLCISEKKHLVTTSYVKPEMQALDAKAKQLGLIFLNEIGVDPGIDHMAAMKIIHAVRAKGGKVKSFYSYCGGLPSLADNNVPLGYKFSWSPSGVMLAATNNGKYMKNDKIIDVPGEKLFEHYWLIDIPEAGTFEAYVNRDSLPYIDLYGLDHVQSMYRGTLRNIGHCESWNYFKKLGLLDQNRTFNFSNTTPREVMAQLVSGRKDHLESDIAKFLKVPEYSVTIKKLEWLGLLSDQKLPLQTASVFDMFAYILENKLAYAEGEVDLLVQHHEFIAEYPGNKTEKITSTMVDTGIKDGDSSMARTVSLPAAIATKLILQNKITLKGVQIPVTPEIYEPVLSELETMNIKLKERVFPIEK
jgi:saccharopine dehydrogenase-like NADP-dependent oxidoreductase